MNKEPVYAVIKVGERFPLLVKSYIKKPETYSRDYKNSEFEKGGLIDIVI